MRDSSMDRRGADLAEAAVSALVEAVEITPKPGLTDGRGPGTGPGCTDPATARWAAKALYQGLAALFLDRLGQVG